MGCTATKERPQLDPCALKEPRVPNIRIPSSTKSRHFDPTPPALSPVPEGRQCPHLMHRASQCVDVPLLLRQVLRDPDDATPSALLDAQVSAVVAGCAAFLSPRHVVLSADEILALCEWLDLSRTHSTYRTMADAADGCTNLTALVARECEHIDRLALGAYVKRRGLQLRTLNVGRTMHLQLTLPPLVADYCPNLTALYVDGFEKMADDDVTALAESCPALRKLDISRCRHTTDTSLAAVARTCAGLEVLRLGRCRLVTDRGVANVARHCPRLRVVELPWCEDMKHWGKNITEDGVKEIARRAPRLERLDLQGLHGVTDAAIAAIAAHCPALQVLVVAWCISVTDAVLRLLIRAPELRQLDVQGCDRVTDAAVINFMKLRPDIDTVHPARNRSFLEAMVA